MMEHYWIPGRITLLAVPVVAVFAICLIFYRRRFLGTGWGALLFLGSVAAGVYLGTSFMDEMAPAFRYSPVDGWGEFRRALSVAAHGAIVLFLVPLAVRLFNKWTGHNLTDAEKLPGGPGIRAWFGAGNVYLAVLVSLCAWAGYDYSFWVVLALMIGLVLAYPAIGLLSRAPVPPRPPWRTCRANGSGCSSCWKRARSRPRRAPSCSALWGRPSRLPRRQRRRPSARPAGESCSSVAC